MVLRHRYVARIQDSSAITHCARFALSPQTTGLVIAKGNILQGFEIFCGALAKRLESSMRSSISFLTTFRPQRGGADRLVVLLENHTICVLASRGEGEFVSLSQCKFLDTSSFSSVRKPIAVVDQRCRCVSLSICDGTMKFAEVNERGDFSTFFDARVNTIYVVDAVFLDQGNLPVIAVLADNGQGSRSVLSYSFELAIFLSQQCSSGTL